MNKPNLPILIGLAALVCLAGCASGPADTANGPTAGEAAVPVSEAQKPVSHMPPEAVEAMKAGQAKLPSQAGTR